MKKSFKILLAAAAVFMVLAVTATLTLSIITMMKVNAINSQTSGEAAAKSSPDEADDFAAPADSGETKDKYEDGVVIAENYPIRSTKAISDAYLSGDASRLDSDDRETLDLASKVLKEIINDGRPTIIEPDIPSVLSMMSRMFMSQNIYRLILEAKASEHSARTIAMKGATDNADALSKELSLEYNKLRQSAITNEIIEISAATQGL